MGDFLIRHAEPTDYPTIIAAVDSWWGGRKMADMLPRLFFVHFRSSSFVAEHDGLIAGFVVGFVSQTFPDEAYIHFVGVHPAFRKSGLGRSLYRRFFDKAAELGCRTVRCVTSPINGESIAFHRRMGFSIGKGTRSIEGVPVIEGYDGPGEDRVLLSKVLRSADCRRTVL